MKKSIISTSLMLLMLVTSCGGKTTTSGTNLDPVKPSTTYTDPDDADKDNSGNAGESIVVTDSKYTQEELIFGDRIFGKDFLQVNSTPVNNVASEPGRVTKFNFSSESATSFSYAPIVGKYDEATATYRPFSMLTEEEYFYGSLERANKAKCDEVGGLYFPKDTLSNGGNYCIVDGFNNLLYKSSNSTYLEIISASFNTGYLFHNEGEDCVKVEYLRLNYKMGLSSSSYSTYDKVYFYLGTKYVGTSFDYNPYLFCTSHNDHRGEQFTELEKNPLDKYGKKDWYYVNTNGHYRFYNEQGKMASAFATTYSYAEPTYTTSWIAANHLNVQVTYETDDDHEYTFETNGKKYKTSHYIFEYTTGKTYQVKNLNYVVLNTSDMKYSNTYFDITYADVRFISNKRLLQYTYSFLMDKDLVLRDDVTDLIGPVIKETKNYYCSTIDGDLSVLTKDAIHTLYVNSSSIDNIYMASECFSVTNSSGKKSLVDFTGKYMFNAIYSELSDPADVDGCRFILGKESGVSSLYLLDLETRTKQYLGERGSTYETPWPGYYLYENDSTSDYRVLNLRTGEEEIILSKSTVSKEPSYFSAKISSRGIYSVSLYRFYRISDNSRIIIKFGEKLILDK